MSDAAILVTLASAATLAIAVTTGAALKAWQGWLDYRCVARSAARRGNAVQGRRRELAALRERVRKLEAIANGGEL